MNALNELIRRSIRDAVFGMQDGLVSTLGAVTGIAAGTNDGRVVALAGLVVVAVESLSMAAGSFLSSKSQRELMESLLEEERRQHETDPEGERREIREMYGKRGYTTEEIAVIERRLMGDRKLLLEDMAHKELGVIPERLEHPRDNAVSMGLSYVIGGSIPVIPFFLLSVDAAQITSVAATGAALFALGAAKGRIVRTSWLRSGLEMLAIGAVACGVGFAFGRLGKRVVL